MDFGLSEEQRIFSSQVESFARRHLADGALARARDPAFPLDVAAMMADAGLLGITFPADGDHPEDGANRLMMAVIAIEQVAMVCPRSADVVQAGNFGAARTLAEFGTADQKRRFLDPILKGEAVLSLAMSEPEAGSAVTALKTEAKPDGEGFRLYGTKVWGTHSADARAFLVYCRFGPGTGGIGSVLVERDSPGLAMGQPSLFMSGETWCQLDFDGCYVPPENVLLPAGGFKKQMSGFNVERIGNTARSLALGRHAFDRARTHALEREQFGQRLCDFQGVQWMFAEMAVKLEAAQLLLYKAASRTEGGLPSPDATAMAKYACNAAGFEVSNTAMQVMGALGYSELSLVEFCVRRTRGWMIAGGSTEMLKNRIAEAVFGERFPQRAKA